MASESVGQPALAGKLIRYVAVLAAVSGCAALAVSFVYSATRDKIAERKKLETEEARSAVFSTKPAKLIAVDEQFGIYPQYDESDKLAGYACLKEPPKYKLDDHEDDRVYAALDSEGRRIGFVASGFGQGYQSRLHALVGAKLDENGKPVITGVYLLAESCKETPGLGTRINEIPSNVSVWDVVFGRAAREKSLDTPPFWTQFKGKTEDELHIGKSGEDCIHAITGATLSSAGMTNAALDGTRKIRMVCDEIKKAGMAGDKDGG